MLARAAARIGGTGSMQRSDVLLGALAVTAGVVVGAVGARSFALGLIAIVFLTLALLTARRPVNLAIAAFVGVFVVQRLGGSSYQPGSSGGITYSDVLVAAAAFLALPALLGTPHLRRVSGALLGLGAYLATLLPTVFLNPSSRADLEWAHRAVIVGGAILVGAWIVREDATRTALRWFAFASVVISIAAVQDCLRHGLGPAGPFGYQKNFVGALLGTALVVVIVARRFVGLPLPAWAGVVLLIGGGLLASQSRGGMLAAGLGLLVAFVLDPRAHTRAARALVVLVTGALAWFAYDSISHQLSLSKSDFEHSSLGVRFKVEQVTRDVWRTSPTVGVGLRYFQSGEFGFAAQAANNDVDNELAESGVIGLCGYVVLQGTAIAVAVRRRKGNPLAVAAAGVVAGALLHGMVDIYWTSGTVTVAFLILGLGLAQDTDELELPPLIESRAAVAG